MPLIARERLFHPRVTREKLATWHEPSDLQQRRTVLKSWVDRLHEGSLQKKNEGKIDRLFLADVFGKLLGYPLYNNPVEGRFLCEIQERVNNSGTADGSLGWFYTDHKREYE